MIDKTRSISLKGPPLEIAGSIKLENHSAYYHNNLLMNYMHEVSFFVYKDNWPSGGFLRTIFFNEKQKYYLKFFWMICIFCVDFHVLKDKQTNIIFCSVLFAYGYMVEECSNIDILLKC